MKQSTPVGSTIEFEARFMPIDHGQAREKLQGMGAECLNPRRLMRRVNMDFADFRLKSERSWVRLRDEGGGVVTLTLKHNQVETVDGIHEVETTVGDYDTALTFLKSIGMVIKSYQETYRESWRLGDVKIELDEWPWLDPMMEIEGPDEAAVRVTADQLGFDWSTATFGPITSVYTTLYQADRDDVNHLPEYKFESTAPWPVR